MTTAAPRHGAAKLPPTGRGTGRDGSQRRAARAESLLKRLFGVRTRRRPAAPTPALALQPTDVR
ncbi:hypothetical protein [Microbacterium oleivorans]|uniref:hypothetical protein n=1 Tax=Microbacterium oleivorans TaxID=273677 RepID=UPI00055BC1C3|nr:hypothetical protein [Microbacterium oleivorans]